MKKAKNGSRLLAVLLAVVLILGLVPAASPAANAAAAQPDCTAALNGSLSYIEKAVASPAVGSVGGEWAVFALARGGAVTSDWTGQYLSALDSALAGGGAVTTWTDSERVALALTSLGLDASNYKGTDLIAAFQTYVAPANRASSDRSVNADIYALLALDSKPYGGDTAAYVSAILAAQLSGGGWGLTSSADADVTATSIQALAPYYSTDSAVKTAVDTALTWLNAQTMTSAESSAQAVVALSALGMDPGPYVDTLLSYYNAATGAFAHAQGGSDNEMATEQAAYALVAYDRYLGGSNTLYDMSDAFQSAAGPETCPIAISYQADSTGFAIARRTFTVSSTLAEQYGYTDAFNGTEVSALDAVVAATIAVYGAGKAAVNSKLTVSGSFISNFMGDGAGNMMYYINGESPSVGATEQQLKSGDVLELFSVRDTTNWSDEYGYFKSGDTKTEALNAAPGQDFTLTLATGVTDWDTMVTTEVPVAGAQIVQVVPNGSGYGTGFRDLNAATDKNGTATLCFDDPGIYILSAVEGEGESPLMAPWLVVTVSSPFADVNEGDWFSGAAAYVQARGLVQGVGDNLFAPSENLSRAMLVTVLYRAEGQPSMAGGVSFTDAQAGQWYSGAVAWASANGIVNGYGDGNFGPADPITREQFAAMLYNYAKWKGLDVSGTADLTQYSDANQVSAWALSAVQWAVGEGLIQGRTQTALVPGGNATRAEAAALFMRFFIAYNI